MADTKTLDLVELTVPAIGDVLPIVDISDSTMDASGSTKRISTHNLFAGGRLVIVVAASDSVSTMGANYICDGTADQTEIQAAIDACSARTGGGIVLLLAGTYTLSNVVTIESNVSLRGQGWGTVITSTASNSVFSLIGFDSGTINSGNPLVNVEIRDLKIDGSNKTQISYQTGNKGIFAQFCQRWLIDNVWVHGTLATGIGTDHMQDSRITNCVVTDCGRGLANANTEFGGNGIGIGTGELADESLLVANCNVRNSGNNGIMFETQGGTSNDATYMVQNCLSQGNARGYRVSGVSHVSFSHCRALENAKQGVLLSAGPAFASASAVTSNDLTLTGCRITESGGDGITMSAAGTGDELDEAQYENILIADCQIDTNAGDGIKIAAESGETTSNVLVSGCQIFDNTGDGIVLDGTLVDIQIQGNQFHGQTGNDLNDSSTSSSVVIRDNAGINPQGVESITVGASPFTYTAGPTPERVYIRGGTVSDITKSSTTLATASPTAIDLSPNEAVVVTYSSAPTMVKDRQ